MRPNNPDRPEDLSEPLGEAVRAVKAAPPPAKAQARALERARRLPRRSLPRPRFRRDLLAAACLVGVVLGGMALLGDGMRPQTEPADKVAVRYDPETGAPLVFLNGEWKEVTANELDGFTPANALVVKGTSRLTTRGERIVAYTELNGTFGRNLATQNSYTLAFDGRSGSGRDKAFQECCDADVRLKKAIADVNKDQEQAEVLRRDLALADAEKHVKEAKQHVAALERERQASPEAVSDDEMRKARLRLQTATEKQEASRVLLTRLTDPKGEGKDGDAELDKKRKDLADAWGHLPETGKEKLHRLAETWSGQGPADRQKSVEDLVKDLPPQHQKAVREYFDKLARMGSAGVTPSGQAEEKGPVVWHRDAARPTLARVYVGDRNSLELVSLQVTVTVEGPRARTVVDHVFRNPHDKQLEGTFEYPLPTGASPSYFAMFLGQTRDVAPPRFARRGEAPPLPDALARMTPPELVASVDTDAWGKLQVAKVAPNNQAKEAYEETVRGRVDPGLLEYAGGNTFRGRVFPIPAKGYNRVLIAYEETLPVSDGRLLYRFPLPGQKLADMTFTLQARSSECRQPTFDLKDGAKVESGGRVTFTRSWKDTKPTGEVVFSCVPTDPHIQTTSGRHVDGGPLHLYARVRPDLPAKQTAPFASHAVFLLDTSLSESPDRFAVSMKLLQAILERDADLKSFNVLAFNAAPAWLDGKGWLANTKEGREKALKKLDGLLLEGATDLGAALDSLAAPPFAVPDGLPINVFLLSDGHLTWGETDAATLVSRFERRCRTQCRFHCYRTGLGAEDVELFEALTRKGGAVFQCFGEADLPACAVAHRRDCLMVKGVRVVGDVSDVLVAGRKQAVYPGGELVVACKAAKAGRATVVVEGCFQGKPYAEEHPVVIDDRGELAGRGWGEVAVAALLALNDPKLDNLVTAYCQHYGVGSRCASFLVLEREEDYKRFKLDEEKAVLPGDLGKAVEALWLFVGQEVTAQERVRRLVERARARLGDEKAERAAHVRKLLALLTEADCALPQASLLGALTASADADKTYLTLRRADRAAVRPYLDEAERRAAAGDVDGAVRVLSTVIEEHTGRSDALRLVGYRLLDLKRPAAAARLFERAQEQRPFEPHSYRDLARSLEESGRYALAALCYEVVLAGEWHNRFRDDLKRVALEEHARLMQTALREKAVGKAIADFFGERLEAMKEPAPKADLRVSISWNTDATDVDLHVIEPDGFEVYYEKRNSPSGGELSQDMTQGYGPERYQIAQARPGEYVVAVHYFAANPTLLGGETHVQVVVVRHAGTDKETVERKTVVLRHAKEKKEVFRIKF
jgi:hypothetical protein